MSIVSPTRSSSSLGRIVRVGSSGRKHSKLSPVHALYARTPTKPKKLQSAHYDETTGTWRCKYCGWNYPNPEPHHHQRRDHKKICPGLQKVHRWLSHSSGRSTEEDTDSYDTSNVTYKPSTPETADTATTKFSLGEEDKKDGIHRLRDGDLAKTGDRVLAPRMLDGEFEAYETPSRKQLQRDIKIQEGGDAKAGPNGELYEQPGIVASGDSSRVLGGSESAKEEVFKPHSDAAAAARKQSLYESDSGLSHQPSQDTSDHADFAGLANSEFVPGSHEPSNGNEERRDFDMERPSSVCEGDRLKGDQLTPFAGERGLKRQAEDSSEGFEHREPSLTIADNQEPKVAIADNQDPRSTTADNQDPRLTATDNQDLRLTTADNQDPRLTTAVNQEPSLITKDNQDPRLTAADNQEPSLITTDNQDPRLTTADEPRWTTADNQTQLLQESDDGDDNLPKEVKKLLPDGQEIELIQTESHPSREGMGEGSGEAYATLTGADAVLRGNEEDEMTEQHIPPNDQDGEDHTKHSDPNALVGDGMDYKGGDEFQSGELSSDAFDEAMQNAVSQCQSEHLDHPTLGDLHGHEIERVIATPTGQLSTAKGVSGTPSHGGVDELSRAQRNWDGWEHVVSGKDRFGGPKMPPLLEEIDDGEEPFSGDSLTSQDRTDQLENDSADKSADIPEIAGVVLKSDEGAGHEIGAQLDGLDWESLLDKSVETQPGESLGSTSADQKWCSDQDGGEVFQGLDQQDGGNAEEVLASQQQIPPTNKLLMKLSAAAANWDDWEDVIKEVPMLVDEISSKKAEDPESSSGEHQTFEVESLRGGDAGEPGQRKTGTVLESESMEDVIDTAPAGLPVQIPENERADWLIDFGEPSVESNSGAATDAIPALALSTPKVEAAGTDFFDLLLLNEASGQEKGANTLDSIPAPQPEDGQTTRDLSKLSSALRNWEDWEDVVRERDRVTGADKRSPLLGSDLGIGVHHSGFESLSLPDKNSVVETGSITPAGSVQASEAPPLTINSSAVVDSGQGVEGLDHEMQPDVTTTSVPGESDDLFRFPKPVSVPNVSSNTLPKELGFPDSVLGQGRKGVDNEEDTPSQSSQPATESPPSAQRGRDNWADVHKNEHVSGGSRQSSPSFEDAHDGELSSENEYPNDHKTTAKVPLGKRPWADWEDLAKSDYMVLDGPGGESLIFKRASDARGSPQSVKSLRGRESPSLEEPDDDDGSPRLRRSRRQPPSVSDDRRPSVEALKGASPKGVVRFDYSAGPLSFQVFDTPNSLPPLAPRKSEVKGDKQSLVSTRRPLLYRDSRRDYTSEIEDMDVTNGSHDDLIHHHDHSHYEHEDALQYDVEKVLRGQTTYELICPICGALITRKIVIRTKKRRFVSEKDPRWRRSKEITPIDDDGNETSPSDTSSESEDATGTWKQGIRPCLGYFFGS